MSPTDREAGRAMLSFEVSLQLMGSGEDGSQLRRENSGQSVVETREERFKAEGPENKNKELSPFDVAGRALQTLTRSPPA